MYTYIPTCITIGKTVGGRSILAPAETLKQYVEKPTPVGKIGVREDTYNILGNTVNMSLTASQPYDLYQHAIETQKRNALKVDDEADILAYKTKAFNLRKLKELQVNLYLYAYIYTRILTCTHTPIMPYI